MLYNFREDYNLDKLDFEDLCPNPYQQFDRWMAHAIEAQVKEPNAMTLATANKNGIPSARIVLLKNYDENGFVFYTNYNSRKGEELLENPHAALVFCWLDLHKQIRIEGSVEKISPEQSTQYFQSRPKGSQIGAVVSPQSSIIKNRDLLKEEVKNLENKYADTNKLPRPEYWGGYIVKPRMIEFWQGRKSRLHDRFRFTLQDSGNWNIDRLAP